MCVVYDVCWCVVWWCIGYYVFDCVWVMCVCWLFYVDYCVVF